MRWMYFALFLGCTPPPEAPEGLDDSTNYLMEKFYSSDAEFEAGIQGFINWYDTEGAGMTNEDATLETVDAYTVGDLTEAAISHLPIDDEILIDAKEGTIEPRDLSKAKGVVSLAEMACAWSTAEALLVRPDQHEVFNKDFEDYERTYLSSRPVFEEATEALVFDQIEDALTPFDDAFSRDDVARSLLMTENNLDPSAVFGTNLEPYPMNLDLRHGLFTINEEEVGVMAIITYSISAAWGKHESNALLQSFSIEVIIERATEQSLRMLAVWSQPKGGGLEPDSPLALNVAVNKALASSQRISDICEGKIDIVSE